MSLDQLNDQIGYFWTNLAKGWRELWQSAANAITRFVPGANTNLPDAGDVDDEKFIPTRCWAMLGGEIFEDDSRLVVRLELPGMDKQGINIDLHNQELLVSGEKRFEREDIEGKWRVLQRAYGSFRRVVQLPCPVKTDDAYATYVNGVLRIELQKDEQPMRGHRLKID
jgi:HSP20 family protein